MEEQCKILKKKGGWRLEMGTEKNEKKGEKE
jgi:hypothetical protein